MKHQPYRSWLLADDPLTAEQRTTLQAHLDECDLCRQVQGAWLHVESRLTKPAHVPAPEGFGERFAARLRAERRSRLQRQVWLIFGFALVGSVGVMALLLPQVVARLPSASTNALMDVLALRSRIAVLGDLVGRLLASLPDPAGRLLGISLMVGLAGAAITLYASLGALWTAAVYRFANPTSNFGGS